MEKNNKYISLIIPTFNSEKFLHETLNSILKQNINLNIFVADGNSKDKTLEIINNYKKYLDIKVISKSDSGQSNALNKSLNFIKTPYFLTLQSDDIILPNMIKEFIKVIEFQKEDFLYISSDRFSFNKGKILKYNFGSKQRNIFVKNGVWFGPFPSMIWNTKLVKSLGGFREDLDFVMDFELVQRFNKTFMNKKINYHINKIYGGLRKHPDAKTTSSILKKVFLNEQQSIKKEYKISSFKQLICTMIYKIPSLIRYKRRLYVDQNKINNYLNLLKNRNIELVING